MYQTPKQIAESLQVSDKTVKRLIKAGKLSAILIGKQWRVHKKDLETFIAKQST